jgi:hypothetical protein
MISERKSQDCLLPAGYHEKTPRSTAGKLWSLACAALGIPILLVYLGVVGSCLAGAARMATRRVSRRGNGRQQRTEDLRKQADGVSRHQECRDCSADRERCAAVGHAVMAKSRPAPALNATFPLWPCLFAVVAYLMFGAWSFSKACGWSFVDALFFCFTALFTIGISEKAASPKLSAVTSSSLEGSAAPLKSVNAPDSPSLEQGNFLFLFMCTLYLLFGLALISACIQLLAGATSFSFFPCRTPGQARMTRMEEELMACSNNEDEPS